MRNLGRTAWPDGRCFVRAALIGVALAAAVGLVPAQDEGVRFTTEGLPDALKGADYLDPNNAGVFLEATGGFTPYVFELREGSLPEGLILGSNGGIAGIASQCENAVFRVMVRDAAGGFDLRTFLIQVTGPPSLNLPATFDPSVEAGQATVLSLPLVNEGCTTVSFHGESVDFGPVVPTAEATVADATSGELGALLQMGAPVPRAIGQRITSTGQTRRSVGWHLDRQGRLVDGDGNLQTGEVPVRPEGFTVPQAEGARVLYVNRSITPGEQERMESLGYTVVESQVPEALDLETLRNFDVLWLTAASDAIFPSRDAVRQFIWEGGGLVIEQAEFSGFAGFLPPGYELFMVVTPPGGDIHSLAFTPAAGSDPLTAGLTESDLPSNYDLTEMALAGPRWTFLAVQADLPDVGTLATAAMGAGRLVYHSGNVGSFTSPVASNGSDAFVTRVLESAASGGVEASCPWLEAGAGISDVRIDEKTVDDVQAFDLTGETVNLQLNVDTRLLLPGSYNCRLDLLTNDPEQLQPAISVTLMVTEPAAPRILQDALPPARPGTPYGTSLLAAGGTPPYVWSLSGGSLPQGLNLDAATGAVFGTPSQSGLFAPEFTLTDSAASSSSATLSLTSGFVITTETLPDATIGQLYAVPLFATGGTPPYSFTFDEAVSYGLPAEDPNSPAGLACISSDLGNDVLSTDCTLPGMTYRAIFGAVDGYFSPATQDLDVPVNGSTLLNAHYTPWATVQVDTNLEEAVYALSASTALGEVDLLGAGLTTTFSELPPGDYSVSFAALAGYATPPEELFTLSEGGSAVITATYVSVLPPDPAGALTQVSTAPMPPPPSVQADIGFGDGNLVVTTDAPGASFLLVGNRPVTGLQLRDPAGGVGTGGALVGRMSTLAFPVLASGERVSMAIIASDAAGNRARRVYAPTVWSQPVLQAVTPGSATLGQELDIQIFGSQLRSSASFSLGDGLDIETGRFDLPSPGGTFTEAVLHVDAGTAINRRDLVYTDPDLADTALGSVLLLEDALRLFTDVGRIDVDGSQRVDGFDLARLARLFGLVEGDALFDPALDLTNDGRIDGEDLASMGVAFGRSTLTLEPADLPPVAGAVGLQYDHRIRFVGGSQFVSNVRILAGELPDGVVLVVEQNVTPAETVQDYNLLLTGIPAEAGTFTIRVQGVDAFFALFEDDLTVTVNP